MRANIHRRDVARATLLPIVGLALSVVSSGAAAQEQGGGKSAIADTNNDIIVTGTRRAERTLADSAVPVDVVGEDALQSVPSSDLSDKLTQLVPSFNVERLPGFDGASFVRPATLRGLSPDETLVLINGKRLHRSAYISLTQHGEQAPDLAQIPEIALSRVEVLRDGASAQYGSDAIAGVINLLLNERPGISADLLAGRYYKGDGGSYQAAVRWGANLSDRGTISLSGEFSSQGATNDAAAVNKVGQPDIRALKLFGNARYKLTDGIELYGFGNANATRSSSEFSYRPPTSSVFARSYYQDNPPFLYPTYRLSNVYPNGFVPIFGSRSIDASLVAGLRGEIADSLHWDLSGGWGRNRIRYTLRNTINASLGPQSPTSFDSGSNVQAEYSANADFTYLLDTGLYRPINVAFGAEWRRERYDIRVGDQAAYIVGPLSDLPSGANGFPSPTPDQANSFARNSRAGYLDLDIDATKSLNFDVAGRLEDIDTFGSTFTYKAASRFKATPWLSLRAAYSTGFHAPSVGQQNLTSTGQGADPNTPPPAPQRIITSGLIPSTNPIALTAGGRALVPERSRNISAGLVLTPAPALTISVDYYRIGIRKRLGLTSDLSLDAATRNALVAQGVSQAGQLTTFRFFINGFDTRTEGVDVVGSYHKTVGSGRLSLTAAYNFNHTRLLNGDPKIVTGSLVQDIEQRLPHHTANASADYQIGRVGLTARVRYYGAFTDALPFLPPSLNQRISPESFFDVSASYQLSQGIKATLGAENIFNNYPDRLTGPLTQIFGWRYPAYRPYEADGGRYYIRLSTSF